MSWRMGNSCVLPASFLCFGLLGGSGAVVLAGVTGQGPRVLIQQDSEPQVGGSTGRRGKDCAVVMCPPAAAGHCSRGGCGRRAVHVGEAGPAAHVPAPRGGGGSSECWHLGLGGWDRGQGPTCRRAGRICVAARCGLCGDDPPSRPALGGAARTQVT